MYAGISRDLNHGTLNSYCGMRSWFDPRMEEEFSVSFWDSCQPSATLSAEKWK